jgi:hypothetical protein
LANIGNWLKGWNVATTDFTLYAIGAAFYSPVSTTGRSQSVIGQANVATRGFNLLPAPTYNEKGP